MTTLLTHSELLSFAKAAVAAPSADNHHHFELVYAEDALLIFATAEFRSAPFHRRILDLISFGAVAENLVVRAAALGYRAVVTTFPAARDESPVARIDLQRSEARLSPLNASIDTRHTNRRLRFSGPKLINADLDAIAGLIEDLPDVQLTFVERGPARSALLRLIRIAEAERFNTPALHEELFSAVRFDVGWKASVDEGLPPAALGVEPGMRLAFERLAHWPTMNVLRKLGVHQVLGFRAGSLPCRTAPHIGVLYTRSSLPAGAMPAGRALQRIWLDAERRKLAFQPLAASALLALPEYLEVPESTGETLRKGWEALSPLTPVIVFRMGRAKPLARRAGRRGALEHVRSGAAAGRVSS